MRALSPAEAKAIRPDSITGGRSSSFPSTSWNSSSSSPSSRGSSSAPSNPSVDAPVQPAPPAQPSEIIVKGHKIKHSSTPTSRVSFSISSASKSPPPTPSDRTFGNNNKIKFKITDPSHNEAAQKAADILQKQVTATENKLAQNPNAVIQMPNGQTMTASQVLSILQNSTYTIVDQSDTQYRAGENYPASDPRSDGSNDVTFDLQGLMGYENSNNQLVDEIILHEAAHDTAAGIQETQAEFDAYRAANPSDPTGKNYDGSPQFMTNEQFTNALASDIAYAAGIPVNSNPTDGFGSFPHH